MHFQSTFGPRRQYKRKDAGPDDEKTRVRMTLLEYGNNGLFAGGLMGFHTNNVGAANKHRTDESTTTNNVNDDDVLSASEVFISCPYYFCLTICFF